MEMIENKMVVDSMWSDWLSNTDYDPYEDATPSSIIAFLIDQDKLHEVVALFLDADPGTYDEMRAEELLLDYMTVEKQNHLIKRYVYFNDIAEAYNEWWFRYHHNSDE